MKTDKVEMREKTNDNKKIIYCDFSDFEKITVYKFFVHHSS